MPSAAKPASPCLASRVPYGTPVDPAALARIDAAEQGVRALGFSVLRVRHHGTHASVEVAPAELGLLRSRWHAVERFFTGLGFERVELDPSGYRRGGLLTLAPHGGA